MSAAHRCCAQVLRTASCPASMAGPIVVRSTQFGGVGCLHPSVPVGGGNPRCIYCAQHLEPLQPFFPITTAHPEPHQRADEE